MPLTCNLAGVEWPATDASGDRSTTVTNQKVFAAATAALDKDAAGRMLAGERVGARVVFLCAHCTLLVASGWRFTYDKHVVAHVKASLQSPDAPIRAGTDPIPLAPFLSWAPAQPRTVSTSCTTRLSSSVMARCAP